jgi:hypothetical protein
MIQEVKRFNEQQKERSGVEIDVGIGLHTGPLIAGNIGSDRKMEYTVKSRARSSRCRCTRCCTRRALRRQRKSYLARRQVSGIRRIFGDIDGAHHAHGCSSITR